MERFSFIFLVGGLGFFVLAFVVSAWLPWMQFLDEDVLTIKQLAADPPLEFLELAEQYPEAFEKAFGEYKTEAGGYDFPAAFAEALVHGRKTYVGEACWHCHSQQVRPVGGDEARFGRVSYPEEYNNDLNYPPLWGTRRVGPDLIREAGKQSNDWHVAHFWDPPSVSPTSVMPRYPWFYEADDPATEQNESLNPNKTGLSIIAYVQWLGSWERTPAETVHGIDVIERRYRQPDITPDASVETGEQRESGEPQQDDASPFGDDSGGADDNPFGGDGSSGGDASRGGDGEPNPFE